jgi:hypothetical protein
VEFGWQNYGKMVEQKFFLLWVLRQKGGKSTENVRQNGGKNMEFLWQGLLPQPVRSTTQQFVL